MKLWDLEQAKVIRTLLGHRAPCISVEFHPYGDFFASGSLDTNLKIWDIRRKSCIQTYKGHTQGVSGAYRARGSCLVLTVPLRSHQILA